MGNVKNYIDINQWALSILQSDLDKTSQNEIILAKKLISLSPLIKAAQLYRDDPCQDNLEKLLLIILELPPTPSLAEECG